MKTSKEFAAKQWSRSGFEQLFKQQSCFLNRVIPHIAVDNNDSSRSTIKYSTL